MSIIINNLRAGLTNTTKQILVVTSYSQAPGDEVPRVTATFNIPIINSEGQNDTISTTVKSKFCVADTGNTITTLVVPYNESELDKLNDKNPNWVKISSNFGSGFVTDGEIILHGMQDVRLQNCKIAIYDSNSILFTQNLEIALLGNFTCLDRVYFVSTLETIVPRD